MSDQNLPGWRFNLRYAGLFLFLELCMMGLMLLAWQGNRSNYLSSQARQFEIMSSALVANYESVAHAVFHQAIDQPEVRRLQAAARDGSDRQREAARTELYRLLLPNYTRLQQESPLKLQLILPDSTSLLRMHQPEKWGDRLQDHRDIVRQALEDQREMSGYDSGRFALGAYRFVFPFKEGKRLLGVVELSLFADTQVALLEKQNPGSSWFMLELRRQADLKLMDVSKQHAYKQQSQLHPDYLEIWPGMQSRSRNSRAELLVTIRNDRQLKEQLDQRKLFSLPVGVCEGLPHAAVFVPIINFKGEHEGYLVSVAPAPLLKQLNRSMTTITVIGTLLVAGVTLLARFLGLRRRELRRERDLLQAITDGMGEGLLVQGQDGMLTMMNPAAEQLLGYSSQELSRSSVHDQIHYTCTDADGNCPILHATALSLRYEHDHEQFIRRDGALLPVSVVATPLIVHGENRGSVMLFSDITEELAQKAQILRLNKLYEALSKTNHAIVHCKQRGALFEEIVNIVVRYAGFSSAFIGMMRPDTIEVLAVAGTIPVCAGQVLNIVGGESGDTCELARTIFNGQPHICLQRCTFYEVSGGKACAAGGGDETSLGVYPLRCDGRVIAALVLHAEHKDAFDPQQTALLEEMVEDVSFALDTILHAEQHQRTHEELQQLSNYDPLTGLPNRTLLRDRIEQLITAADKNDSTLGLLLVGLDRFKTINNSFGHAVGDRVLREAARRLQGELPHGATLARPGNDEFLLLVPDAVVSEVAHLAGRLMSCIAENLIEVAGQAITVTACVGISVWPSDAADGESLLKHAYSALNRAKQGDVNSYQFFTADMTERSIERLTLENELRQALERQQFVLYYQPKIDLQSGAIAGCEALVRWQHPERGLVPPNLFIPIMEETGLIGKLGSWVLHEACRQAVLWHGQGLSDLVMAVNISPLQLKNRWLPSEVADVLRGTGLRPDLLELEITESSAMQDIAATMTLIADLKQLGLQIAIDDFGTGYSSLAYLKRLAADTLKIDRSFVCDLPDDKEDAAIAEAIMALAKTLHMRVVAEGVETIEQLAFLRSCGCQYVQGYYYAKPLPADEFLRFAAAQKRL